jgi:cytochrome c556
MKRGFKTTMALVCSAGIVGLNAQQPAVDDRPGWTGITAPEEVIEARRGLMDELERLIGPIDTFTVSGTADLAQLQSAGMTISRMLLAVPHLFPPTTDLYDPTVLESPTNTLPALWRDFDTFFALAEASEIAATALTSADGAEAVRAAARGLRASCDACHALYLKVYVPPKVTAEDLNFDFDAFLPKN